MLQALFSGVSGMQAHQTEMNVIGNNISNVNTTAYKSSRVTFQDQLSQTLRTANGETDATGGTNPVQVGVGVQVGAIDTIQTQGNLQATGKGSDMAIQGNGMFMVANNGLTNYTRDGSFNLDSNGYLVSSGTGALLLGYPANAAGVIDTTAQVTAASKLQIPLGVLTAAQQTNNVGFLGNLDAGAALVSTKADFTGNLDSAATGSVTMRTTVYDAQGNAHSVDTTFLNPTNTPGGGAPAGATRQWDVQIKVDDAMTYDSTIGKAKLYRVGSGWTFGFGGTALGGALKLDGGAGANSGPAIAGTNGAPSFAVNLNYGSLTNVSGATPAITASTDGQTGSDPKWTTSTRVYDTLGVEHYLTFTYNRAHVSNTPPPPLGSTAQWNWSVSENGKTIMDSQSAGNSPLYFGTDGKLLGKTTQSVTVSPTDGSVSPFTITIDNSKLTQLSSSSTLSPGLQDGYPSGTLSSYSITSEGVINGLFTSGQTKALGQIALVSFANPGGLEKVGNNLYRESTNSGSMQIGPANESGRGKIASGFLEMSNVDLSTEFTNLIVTQRGFQANSKIITVVDELLQEVINLKR